MNNKRLGQILVRLDLITEAQLEQCLGLLTEISPPISLASLLIRRQVLDERTLASVAKMDTSHLEAELAAADGPAIDVESRLVGANAGSYLTLSRDLGASDLFLTPEEAPMIRLHGHLVELDPQPISAKVCRDLLFSMLDNENVETFENQKHVDVSIVVPDGGRYRANIFQHSKGVGGVFRVIADEVVPFDQLGLPEVVQEFVHFTQGLVLVTGPTGSGKSTTLASLINIINDTYKLHVVSLEDPIEVVHESRESLITQREISAHSESFATGLRAALREDPDVIVVGEMRDSETIATALTAAETGHLVLGTLHTRDAYSTILRVVDQFPAHKRAHVRTILARVLRAVVCQDLIPNRTGDGRVLASEVMIVNPAISNLIREDRTWQINSVVQISGHQGMQMMDDCLEELVRTEKIARREATVRATERERFELLTN